MQPSQPKNMTTNLIVITIIALLLAQPSKTKASIHGIRHAFVTHIVSKKYGGDGSVAATAKSSQRAALLPHLPLSHHRRQAHTRLASTTAKGTSGPSTQQSHYNVLYQKVLRAPKSSSHTFLLDLVSFLQCVFQLPNDLPMPYEITVPDDSNSPSDNRAVLVIDSPLSNDPHETCLEVEVIGIFPDDSDVQAGPTMAMVALKKRKDPNNTGDAGSGVTQGLFAASEQRIVQTLDRGLQDLEEGRVSIPQSGASDDDIVEKYADSDDDGVDAAMKRMGYKNSIEAASALIKAQSSNEEVKVPKDPISIERDGLGNIIIDSTASPTTSPKKAEQKVPKEEEKSMPKNQKAQKLPNQPAAKNVPTSTSTQHQKEPTEKSQDNDDYAIKMARQQAEALMTTVRAGTTTSSTQGTVAISGGESDFAIMAAKNAAKRRKTGTQAKKESKKNDSIKGQEAGDANPSVAPTIVKKGKVQDLSNDEMFLKLQKIANKAKQASWKRTIPKMKKKSSKSLDRRGSSNSISGSSRSDSAETQVDAATTIKITKENGKKSTLKEKSDDEIRDDVLKIAQQNEKVRQELKAATDFMPVEKEGEEGLTPEELLEQVLKFGDEKDKEEKPGHGFVEGAFGKARELLREGDSGSKDIGFKDKDSTDEMRRKAEEEELKRIFSAGQSMAESRLSNPTSRPSNLAKPSITEEDIDELIDADETVPRNARVLDDELAELEVRMSRSQEEEADGPPQNRMFDVFSGPEVYNPNVDPEKAVNWPGAKEGTRTDVKLATDLSTALKQAQFASAVLSQMREEVNEENGEVKYFVGTKELPLDRVSLLQKCVSEAVKAGIIEDPEIIGIERSRLQMLVDELVSQPEERLEEISMNYKDLLLSDNLVDLIKERLHAMAQRDLDARRQEIEDTLKETHARERAILINLAQIAQALVKEAQALGAELEVSMLEIIRSICEVAMDPSHKSEEDTAIALTDAVRDMRPLLDDAFVAYLKYAIAEEEGKLARAGVLDDPEHNRWLFVLKIVQEGVYTELSQGVKRYVDHIWYVLRMKSKSERKELLKKLVDVMPTMDVRPFVKVVSNIVSSLGTTVKGDFADGVILGEMTNQLLQLQSDVNELLPPEKINEMSKDADEWAAAQRQKLLERRNLTRQRLEAARQTGDIDPDEVIKKPGVEAERFD